MASDGGGQRLPAALKTWKTGELLELLHWLLGGTEEVSQDPDCTSVFHTNV